MRRASLALLLACGSSTPPPAPPPDPPPAAQPPTPRSLPSGFEAFDAADPTQWDGKHVAIEGTITDAAMRFRQRAPGSLVVSTRGPHCTELECADGCCNTCRSRAAVMSEATRLMIEIEGTSCESSPASNCERACSPQAYGQVVRVTGTLKVHKHDTADGDEYSITIQSDSISAP